MKETTVSDEYFIAEEYHEPEYVSRTSSEERMEKAIFCFEEVGKCFEHIASFLNSCLEKKIVKRCSVVFQHEPEKYPMITKKHYL